MLNGLTARNTGLLPTVPAIGVKTRRLHGLVFAFDPDKAVPRDRLLAGDRVVRFDSIEGSGAHAHASWLLSGGSDLKSVMERMGHAQIQTTQKYLHTLPGADQKNLDALDRASSRPRG